MDLWFRTLAIAFGGAGVACCFAILPAVLSLSARLGWCHRFVVGMISSFLLMPTYVVAGAWSAGFGVQGWWTLSQVTASRAPSYGLLAVIWIHAMAAFPFAYWLLRLGFHYGLRERLDVAKLDGGVGFQFARVIVPHCFPWWIGSIFLIAAWISGDVVVTNLFQVSTLAEDCYLALSVGEPHWSRSATSMSLSLFLGIAGSFLLVRLGRRFSSSSKHGNSAILLGWGWSFATWGVVAISVVLPVINLIVKSGWTAFERPGIGIQRAWLLDRLLHGVAVVPSEFRDELYWTWLLSSTSAVVAMVAGFALSRLLDHDTNEQTKSWPRIMEFLLIVSAIGAFTLPGPVVTSLVRAFFQLPIFGLAWLFDNTLAAPIACLQFHLLPVSILAFGLFRSRWRSKNRDLWIADRSPLWIRSWILGRWYFPLSAVLFFVLFAIAAGELSSYLLCLPPGVTTVALRVFDLLHYGVRSEEAGLLVFLALLGGTLGVFVGAILQRKSESMLH